jgi:ArsR family transcriptional regulator
MDTIYAEHAIKQAELFRTLMHPIRIAILEVLRDEEQCVCHLEAYLGQRQAAISQQLAVLRKAGLIADRRVGLNIYYRIVRSDITQLLDAARNIVNASPPSTRPTIMCPCPKCRSVPIELF